MIVFVSNYYNHHQAPLSKALFSLTNGQYRFIATKNITEERIKLGWESDTEEFVMQYSQTPEECQMLIDSADVVLFGGIPYKLIKRRLKKGLLTFLYSERIYKKKCAKWKHILHSLRFYNAYGKYSNMYLLCASAYAATDYDEIGIFKGKSYKWGYFPKINEYDSIDRIIESKEPNSLIWVARMIDWKHPELPIMVAKRLKAEGYSFNLNMIGTGIMENQMLQMVENENLQDCVHLLGAMKPEQVREYMEKSQIYLFTSDRQEGWGAVLNESMNSGCAVVANYDIGSVPYLIQNGENGFSYTNEEELYKLVKDLLNNESVQKVVGRNSYKTITEVWNANNAAMRFLQMIDKIVLHGECTLFDSGPCSLEGVKK